MTKPLKNLMPNVIVTGELQPTYNQTPELDAKGNLKPMVRVGKMQLTVKAIDNQPQYRATYGIVGNRLIVECHIIQTWVKTGDTFIAFKLEPQDFIGTLKNNDINLTIIQMAQYNLKPLIRVMGKKFIAIQDGSILI